MLKIEGLEKSFGIETLFRDVAFTLERGEKAGLIGANGAGKTTLLRCLLGLEEADRGRVVFTDGESVGYVEQEAALGAGALRDELGAAFGDVLAWRAELETLEGEIAAAPPGVRLDGLLRRYAAVRERFEQAGGYELESRLKRIAFGLGFDEADLERPANAFSGGQKTRIRLAKALVRQPDFLFLDEPTNHLDIAMAEWLENFLAGYPGGVLLISHDRYFLDKAVRRIIELDNKTAVLYGGNYTAYQRLKAERSAALAGAYEKQRAYIAKTEEYIRRYKAGVKAKQARGREKQLQRLERIVLPASEARFSYFAFHPPGECAERAAEFLAAGAAYGERAVFDSLSFLIRRGDGVALVGPNGAGKTTLLKLLLGELEPAAGAVKLGSRVRLGYFSQEHETLNSANRLIDELMLEYDLTEERARSYLGAFLFGGDDVFKIVGDLSGGEKARLAFLKLMLAGANFLVLDEPTNHLDIPAKEAVEEALMAFPGTFIAVSHDRYFLDKVANCVLELENGVLTEYGGNYSYYRQKKAAAAERGRAAAKPAGKREAAGGAVKKGKPRPTRPQDQEKLARRLEGEIAMLEEEIKGAEYRLNDPASHADPAASRTLADEYARLQAALEEKYAKWAEL